MAEKIVHCFWAGGPKTKLAQKCRASWEKFAPDWEIREWDEAKAQALASIPGYRFFAYAIEHGKWSAASDWVRMAALYQEGGLYLDFDHELVAPIEGLPEGEWVASEFTISGGTEPAAGAGLRLHAGSPLAARMLEEYEKMPIAEIDELMPWIVGKMRNWAIRVLEPEVMSPIDTHGINHRCEKTIGIHHYAMSWSTPRRKLARWLNWHGLGFIVDFVLRRRSK